MVMNGRYRRDCRCRYVVLKVRGSVGDLDNLVA